MSTHTCTPNQQGRGVPPKEYKGGWFPPSDVDPESYSGPYPMHKFEADYGACVQLGRWRTALTQPT